MRWSWLLLLAVGLTSGANILVLSPLTSYSHTNFFIPVIKELAQRGNNLTYWNGLKPREEMTNVNQLYSDKLHDYNKNHQIGFDENKPLVLLWSLRGRLVEACDIFYSDPVFQQLVDMKNTTRFDLIIIEGFLCECMLPLVAHFKAPFVYMTSILRLPWLVQPTDNPMSFDHFPVTGTTFTDEMNLFERFVNMATGLTAIYFRQWFMLPVVDRMAAQIWGDSALPSSADIENNLSLWITNSHLSINYQYPKTATIIEAGGLHFSDSKPLPQDVQEFVDGSGDAGFIVLSFGSILKGANLPEATRGIFARTFARLPQRVLWKFEDERGIQGLSPNVRLFRWLPPYMDLLAHPKIRLLITHGGLFSNQEAVYHQVPLIGMPVFGDQTHYTKKAQKDGYALHLDWQTLTEDILYDAITDIISDPKYKERVSYVSRLMKDQIDRPLDRAVYWIEYVMRYQGASHLRTSARHLLPYQRSLLDITFLLMILTLLVGFVTYRAIRSIGLFRAKSSKWCAKKNN